MKSRRSVGHPVLGFAIASLVVVVATGVAISTISYHEFEAQQFRAATYQAEFVAESVLRTALTPHDLDFLVPIEGDRYDELAGFVRHQVLSDPLRHVEIWRTDGLMIFSDDRSLVGRRQVLPLAAAAAVRTRTTRSLRVAHDPLHATDADVIQTFVPISLDLDRSGVPVAVAEVDQTYEGVRAASAGIVRELVPALVAGLAALYLLLLPIVRRLSGRLARQNAALEHLVETERRGAHERRRLLDKLLQVSEDERKRFAAELHDGPIQRLAGLTLLLHRAHVRITRGKPDEAEEILKRGQDALADEVQTLRRMMANLRPPALEERGLEEALRDHLDSLRLEAPVQFGLHCELDGPVDEDIETVLYRVTQEAVQNVVKHADATHSDVRMRSVNGTVRLEVSDDGHGFDFGSNVDFATGEHFGLLAMRERVQSVGGTLSIESNRGTGTRIFVSVPRTLEKL